MSNLKPIETLYNGYRFRSRLEARWAVFFDNLSIRYEYEKEGFDLGDAGWYLPDFWLPEQKCWIEIKGQVPNEQEIAKVIAFAKQSSHPISIFCGNVGECSAVQMDKDDASPHWMWCECPVCGAFEIYRPDTEPPYSSALMHITCLIEYMREAGSSPEDGHFTRRFQTPRLNAAYDAARSARFEHGENS